MLAAVDAARDASLYAGYLVTAKRGILGHDFFLKHVKERWNVWQNGFALLCDLDGTLYGYCKMEKPTTKNLMTLLREGMTQQRE